MPTHQPRLVGTWVKLTQSDCSGVYPHRLEFRENGIYFGQKEPPGGFTQWDLGTYEVVASDKIKISTANDALVTYEFVFLNDLLTFVDPDHCRFEYRRAP